MNNDESKTERDDCTSTADTDETCEFCEGRSAYLTGQSLSTNPYPTDDSVKQDSVEWWATPHGLWKLGWESGRAIHND